MANYTIRDIARLAEVSITTVSFVLNNKPGISEDTRKRVLKIIDETGFIPNVHTRRLNLGRSFTIHVVLYWHSADIFNQFALEIMHGVFSACKKLHYTVLFTFVDRTWDINQIVDSIHSKACDGLILSQIENPTILTLLEKEEIPFVCVDSHIKKDGRYPLVEVDYYKASYDAVKYLIEKGHNDIGYCGCSTPHELHESTFNGYIDAMRDSGLRCNPTWIGAVDFEPEAAGRFFRSLVDNHFELPSAFFCSGDAFAIDLIHTAQSMGYKVPDDFSVICEDDILVSKYVDPALTTMGFDKEQLGEEAVSVLHRIITGEDYNSITLMKPTLIRRASVAEK